MNKSTRPPARATKPCRCGTGTYCRRHLRYAVVLKARHRSEVADPHLTDDEPCGGGQRVIRKVPRD